MTVAPPPVLTVERCVVCDAPLTALDALTRPTCGAHACRWRYQSAPAHERCRVCERPLAPAQRAARLCDAPHCQGHIFRVMRERRRQKYEALLVRARARRDAAAADAGITDVESYPITAVDANRRAVVPLTRHRRRAYRARLAWLIAEAVRQGDTPPPAEEEWRRAYVPVAPEVDALFGQTCAFCRGGCCTGGDTHAHLAVGTLRRWLDEHPASRPRDALAAYLSHLPGASYEGSCVNHTERGCALPRALRSDTCNRYYCGALVVLRRRAAEEGGAPRAFVVAERDVLGEEGAFLGG